MHDSLMRFSETLQSFSDYSDLFITWHFTDNALCSSVAVEQTGHRCGFCHKVKDEPSRANLRQCIRDHHATAFERALRERRPFIFQCHAGALEAAVPVFSGGSFIGLLFAGTFRDPARKVPPAFEDEYAKLPGRDMKSLMALGLFLEKLAAEYLGGAVFSEHAPELVPCMHTADTRVLRAILFMRRHADKKFTASEAAAAAGLSMSRFLHIFSRETGFAFSDFLQRVRVGNALRLVEGSDIPFGRIAEISGIADQSRMTVLFRRYLGATPRALRTEANRVTKRFLM